MFEYDTRPGLTQRVAPQTEPAPPSRGAGSLIKGAAGLDRQERSSNGQRTWERSPECRSDPAEADEARLVALDVIEIFAARFALQIVLAVRVEASHPLVVQVEPTEQPLGCGGGHDDLRRSME